MRKIFTCVLFCCISLAALSQTTFSYTGNGGAGFGGAIGKSKLDITENVTTLAFTLTRTSGTFDNAFVIYMDTTKPTSPTSTGANSTASYTDASDRGRTAVSGVSPDGRSILNFPTGFGADYAIVVSPFNSIHNLYTHLTHTIH